VSRTAESVLLLVDRVLDHVTQTLPEVVNDAAIKNKQVSDEVARLDQELHDNQVNKVNKALSHAGVAMRGIG